MRKPIFAANWKMNKTIADTEEYLENFAGYINKYDGSADIVIIPPFTALAEAKKLIDLLFTGNKIFLGAQNLYGEDFGAFTGEVCADMLVDAGCRYVIIGHSERRRIFNETNDLINKKVAAALKSGLNPIVCIGETKEERLEGKTFSVLDKQISESLDFFESDDLVETVIAYEPVWAIGTGLTATPQQAQEAHSFIRKKVSDMFGSDFADTKIRIQYGGSVKSDNIKAIMANPDVDGALIGGASLDPEGFFKIISFDR